jgi:hypothetical protein
MRGTLIFAFLAELHRLDTLATSAVDPDGAGPLSSGYDPDFKEPLLVDADEDGLGSSTRREHTPVQLPCQVEPDVFEALAMAASGHSPRSEVKLVFHFRDLERLGLVDLASGEARVRVGDRLGALLDRSGALVQRIRTPPGLYVTEARPIGFGLFRPRPQRNLLLATFQPRSTTAPRGVSP